MYDQLLTDIFTNTDILVTVNWIGVWTHQYQLSVQLLQQHWRNIIHISINYGLNIYSRESIGISIQMCG